MMKDAQATKLQKQRRFAEKLVREVYRAHFPDRKPPKLYDSTVKAIWKASRHTAKKEVRNNA
jgi:hypothetical protein